MNPGIPIKSKNTNWREIKLQKRKWKEERLMKKLRKMEENNSQSQASEVINHEEAYELHTLSIAVPGSILLNAQSYELRTYVVGQIARAACIYKVDEIIVFNDKGDEPPSAVNQVSTSRTKKASVQFARLLQYLECPQYLRKHFFPLHKDLQYAGVMNPLDAPHHLRQDENFQFREGVTTDKLVKNGKGTYVEVGLLKQALVDKALQPGLRVTVKLLPQKGESKKIRGIIVTPDTPQKELNMYWGYSVRIAHSISEIFSKCPFQGGYDLTIGTSDKGRSIDEIKKKVLRHHKHNLIVFGGLEGLESALESDNSLQVNDVSFLFDHYINVCPKQGSRTIRTEEAVFISLAELRKKMFKNK